MDPVARDVENRGRGMAYVRFRRIRGGDWRFLVRIRSGHDRRREHLLARPVPLDDAQLGLATGSAVLGCMFGPFLGAWLCDAIGRKRTMIMAAFLLADERGR